MARPDLVLGYAAFAANAGWNDRSFAAFCDSIGVSAQERTAIWPRGARSVARAWTVLADEAMLARHRDLPAFNFETLILSRFVQHAGDRPAVMSLARMDFWHPIDTLTRTAATADAMWRCQGHPRRASGFDRWRLALAYCVCVAVWMGDRSAERKTTQRLTRAALALAGLR